MSNQRDSMAVTHCTSTEAGVCTSWDATLHIARFILKTTLMTLCSPLSLLFVNEDSHACPSLINVYPYDSQRALTARPQPADPT